MAEDRQEPRDEFSEALMDIFGRDDPPKNKLKADTISEFQGEEREIPSPKMQQAFLEHAKDKGIEDELVRADRYFYVEKQEDISTVTRIYFYPFPTKDGNVEFKERDSITYGEDEVFKHYVPYDIDHASSTNRPKAFISFPKGSPMDMIKSDLLALEAQFPFHFHKNVLTVHATYDYSGSKIADMTLFVYGGKISDTQYEQKNIDIVFDYYYYQMYDEGQGDTQESLDLLDWEEKEDLRTRKLKFKDKTDGTEKFSVEIQYQGKDVGVLIGPWEQSAWALQDKILYDGTPYAGDPLDMSDKALARDDKWRNANIPQLAGIQLISKEDFLKRL